jgi:hypothetical protein
MGFGLLLIGYMFAFVARIGLGEYIFAGMLLGGFFMYLGLSELKKYSPAFIYSFICSIFIILSSFLGVAIWVDTAFGLGLGMSSTTISVIYEWSKFLIGLAFNVFMLYGIIDISNRVDYPDTKLAAQRNFVFVAVFNLCQLLLLFPISFIQNDLSFFNTLLIVIQLIYSIANALLIFKCYAMICQQGQEDMPRKPSKFAFVNKIRAIRDAKEEKAIEDMKVYYEEKLKRKNSKKKKKKK